MKKKLLLLSLIASASLVGCKTLPTQPTANMANPAATYCVEHGGNYQITTNKDGSQAGVCHFKNGSQCDGWEYLRGQCKRTADKPILY
ncbi:DUF333 domain-containing protein [Photobacterium leiognathi]|uniref:putative hemolysin n=1 Tax=Photobacterium leiognathi TaxID=553611 RepID=UPI0027324018|nr:DUF333 domain-containing protein [Photobacterium leiognathi]